MARKFNGTSDYIQVDAAVTSAKGWYNDPDGFAYAGWIKAPAGQSNVGIYSEGVVGNNNNFWWLSIVSGGTNKLHWSGGTSFTTPSITTTATIADNTWHHVALVVYPIPVSGNWWGLYVDGVLDQSNTMGSTFSGGNTTQAAFGALRRTTTANFLNGYLAHWGIWKRALSGEEIRMLARGHLPSQFGPFHYFPMTGPDFEASKDFGRFGAHGHLVGTTPSADVPPLAQQPRPVRWVQRFSLGLAPAPAGVIEVIPASAEIQILADPPLVPAIPPTAQIKVVADDASSIPLVALSSSIEIVADTPTIGPNQPVSAKIELLADPPTAVGAVTPSASAVVQVKADAPKLFTGLKPLSGQIQIRSDAPTLIPVSPPSAKIQIQAGSPTNSPTVPASGRIKIVADSPVVFPIQVPSSARIVFAADTDTVSETGLVAKQSGIIRILADIPTVTPLTEPPTPPPPAAGEGIAGTVIV